MVHYSMLAEAEEIIGVTAWRFKVKILRVYPYFVFGDGPYWSYILADEAGSKIEMVIYLVYAAVFSGFEKREGKWIEIFRVEVDRAFTGFRPKNSRYRLAVSRETGIKTINPLNNKHYIEFLSLHQICDINTNIDVPIDSMGVICSTGPLEFNSQSPAQTKIVFHIRDARRDNRLKCVAISKHACHFSHLFSNTLGKEVIMVLKFWRIYRCGSVVDDTWVETVEGLSDFRFNPRMKEVQDFKDELEPSDCFSRV